MYGTIFRMKVVAGKEQNIFALFEKWDLERKPKVPGVIASYVLKADKAPGEFWGVAVFRDKKSYSANSRDPEQDKWYQHLRLLLESDPEWHDGEFVFAKPG